MSDQSRPMPAVALSSRSVELLLDLVEIKLAAMDTEDRDVREIWYLKKCREELKRIEHAGRRAAPHTGVGRSRNHHAAA